MDGTGCNGMMACTEANQTVAGKTASRTISLTDDALSRVFLILSHSKADTADWEWVTVAEVCRFWHVIAIETPALWTFLCRFESAKRTRRYLRLSKNADITVYYSDEGLGFSVAKEIKNRLSHNLRMVLQEIHRIKHLYILDHHLLRGEWENINALIQKPTPRIHTIHFDHLHDCINLSSLLTSSSLQSLTMDGYSSRENIASLHGLRDLSVHISSNDLPGFHSALEACPGLVTLSVGYSVFDEKPFETNNVFLPYLRRLRVRGGYSNGCFKLMEMIDAPNVVFLDICIGRISSFKTEDSGIISKFVRKDLFCEMICFTLGHGLELMLNRRTWIEDDDYSGGAYVYFSRMPMDSLDGVSDSILDVFQSYLDKSDSLQISDHGCCADLETWHSALNRSTSVKHFTITLLRDFDELSCVKALIPLDDTTIPCPKLSCLTIQLPQSEWNLVTWISGEFLDVLETMLRKRSKHGLAVHKLILKSSRDYECGIGKLARVRNLVENLILECHISEKLKKRRKRYKRKKVRL